MPKLKTKVTKEHREEGKNWGGGFTPPPVGLYRAKSKDVSWDYSKDRETQKPDKSRQRLEIHWEMLQVANNGKLEDLPERYGQVWDYISTTSEGHAPRLAQFYDAIGLLKGNKKAYDVELDYDKNNRIKKLDDKEVLLRITAGTNDNGDYRPVVGSIVPFDPAAFEGEDEDEDGEEESEPEDDEEDEEEDDDLEDDDEDEDEDGLPSDEEIDGYDKAALKEAVAQYGVKIPKGTKTNGVRELLKQAIAALAEEEEDEDDDVPF